MKYYKNMNIHEVVTPVNVDHLEELLKEANYNDDEMRYLCAGFRNGFDLEYRGPTDRTDLADNLPFRVGNSTELWNKVMDEVEVGRFAGLFEEICYDNTYIQSPIGLVPKSGNKTRVIFHLSYTFKNGNKSVNHWTPQELCSVHYNDLDCAVHDCIKLMCEFGIQTIYLAKSDLKSPL